MHRFFLFRIAWLVLLLHHQALSQLVPPSTSLSTSLTGIVLDSLTRQPVAFASLRLLPASSGTSSRGATADEQGRFVLSNVPVGDFWLRTMAMGYGLHSQPVRVTPGRTGVDTVLLSVNTQTLAEVVVTATKPLVSVLVDRLVYQAAQDISNAGGNAADVLRKTPLLAVDGDGHVTLRGSTNFKVLVNDRPSPTLADNLADALRSIPADQIARVEVITTPSARYDGEGTAGIINIVLKTNVRTIGNGQFSLSSGNRESRLSGAFNKRYGKVNLTSSVSLAALYLPGGSVIRRLGYSDQGIDTLDRTGSRFYRQQSAYGTLGLDYSFTERQSLFLTGSANLFAQQNQTDLMTNYGSPVPVSSYVFGRATKEVVDGLSLESTATYVHRFSRPGQEWRLLSQYAHTTRKGGYQFEQADGARQLGDGTPVSYREDAASSTPIHEATLQTDYAQHLSEHTNLEVGLKGIFRYSGSMARVDTLYTRYNRVAPDASRATDFGYHQQVQAAYAAYSMQTDKRLTFSFGSRVERTGIAADFSATRFVRSYLTWLPSGFVQYKFNEVSSLRITYSRRITRPSIYYLNPFVRTTNPGFLLYGNPTLAPELTDAGELSYNVTKGSSTLGVSASVRQTGNAIEAVNLPTTDPSLIATTFANIAATSFYQLHLSAGLKPTGSWTLSLGADLQYVRLHSPALGAARQGLTAALTLNTAYKLPRGYALQSFFYGALPTPTIQGRSWASPYYTVGIRKALWQQRAELTFNLSCPATTHWASREQTTTPLFEQTGIYYQTGQRALRVSFLYRLGQQPASRARKNIENDDMKLGGDK